MALVRFEIRERHAYAGGRAFGEVGAFEQIDGIAHFAVDPLAEANRRIVDLALAPRDGDGRVCFQADLSVIAPVDPGAGNGTALVELPNRGRRRVVPVLNRAPHDAPVTREPHPGDGFLFRRGYTVASIGWQWDVFRDDALMGLEAPLALRDGAPVGGQTMVEIRPSERTRSWLLADRQHRPLPAAAGAEAEAVLYVRDHEDGEDHVVPSTRWRFARDGGDGGPTPSREHLLLEGGFDPGRIYQLVYDTDRAPVAGVGLLAMRDVAPFLRSRHPDNPTRGGFDALIAWGVSQTGRMQRHYLSLGLNRCEDGGFAYDGLHIHVAGARRGAFNHRFAQPSNQTTPLWGHVFPFADLATGDPLTGAHAGLLDRVREQRDPVRIVSTNSAAEYWRGDATLAHVATDASGDVTEYENARSYLFSSTQHGAGYPGQSRTNPGVNTTARHELNLLDYRPLLRAALVNLEHWIGQAVVPPPSRHPRLGDGTAVTREQVLGRLQGFPGLHCPDPGRLPVIRTVDLGGDEALGVGRYPAVEGAAYPALVSDVDADGNEVAGVRLPDVSVPVATHTGWNPRDPDTGAPEQIVPMNGLSLPLCRDPVERERLGDPRPSLAERYSDEADYANRVRAAALDLVQARYLLEEDIERCVDDALARYRHVLGAGALAGAATVADVDVDVASEAD